MSLDAAHILGLVIDGKKPACELWETKPEHIRMARLSNLEIRYYDFEGTRYFQFGLPGTKGFPLVANARELFGGISLAHGIERIAAELQDKTVVEALNHLALKLSGPPSLREGAHMQMLQGLLLGYPACCIRYLIERNYDGKRHAYETDGGDNYYLRCESCSKNDVWASWCGARN